MDSYYEKFREDQARLIVHKNCDHSYAAHFHLNLEILLLKRGEYRLSVNEKAYTVNDDCIAIIDSYAVHEYRRVRQITNEKSYVILIPFRYLQTFNARRKNGQIANCIIKDGNLCDRLINLVNDYFFCKSESVTEAAVNLFLAELAEALHFTSTTDRNDGTLMRKILTYIQENFREKISRETIARTLGYTPAHISRVFHRYLKRGISDYVNELRLAYVKHLRRIGDNRATFELLYEAGFQSPQTYYRCKKKYESSFFDKNK
ncbi:MAG: helix-turn-helix transcriptional regulator [Clostridia bacterium]|nr:helix-turn-helix transcriptional regulator [Clostridia bacterium]